MPCECAFLKAGDIFNKKRNKNGGKLLFVIKISIPWKQARHPSHPPFPRHAFFKLLHYRSLQNPQTIHLCKIVFHRPRRPSLHSAPLVQHCYAVSFFTTRCHNRFSVQLVEWFIAGSLLYLRSTTRLKGFFLFPLPPRACS